MISYILNLIPAIGMFFPFWSTFLTLIYVVCVFETNSDGEFVTPKELFPSKYRLEEIEQDIIGYLWNSDPIEFIIDENTPTQNDPLYGTVYIQEFVNHSYIWFIFCFFVNRKMDIIR